MAKKDKTGPLTSLPKKYDDLIKKMPEFKETADSGSIDDLKNIIVECEGNLFVINESEAADVKLSGAKEFVKEYSAPHKEAKKFQQAKIQYAILCLQSKGVELDNQDES
ncbi:MAG TPA: hypothetical protein VII94_02375 [Candidatus Saccharimonadales bacterium]